MAVTRKKVTMVVVVVMRRIMISIIWIMKYIVQYDLALNGAV